MSWLGIPRAKGSGFFQNSSWHLPNCAISTNESSPPITALCDEQYFFQRIEVFPGCLGSDKSSKKSKAARDYDFSIGSLQVKDSQISIIFIDIIFVNAIAMPDAIKDID